jgi:hypothetical protein
MSLTAPMDDAQALEHYRAECRRLRAGIRDLACRVDFDTAERLELLLNPEQIPGQLRLI